MQMLLCAVAGTVASFPVRWALAEQPKQLFKLALRLLAIRVVA